MMLCTTYMILFGPKAYKYPAFTTKERRRFNYFRGQILYTKELTILILSWNHLKIPPFDTKPIETYFKTDSLAI